MAEFMQDGLSVLSLQKVVQITQDGFPFLAETSLLNLYVRVSPLAVLIFLLAELLLISPAVLGMALILPYAIRIRRLEAILICRSGFLLAIDFKVLNACGKQNQCLAGETKSTKIYFCKLSIFLYQLQRPQQLLLCHLPAGRQAP